MPGTFPAVCGWCRINLGEMSSYAEARLVVSDHIKEDHDRRCSLACYENHVDKSHQEVVNMYNPDKVEPVEERQLPIMAQDEEVPEILVGDSQREAYQEVMTLTNWLDRAHQTSVDKGWWDAHLGNKKGRNVPEMLCLIHSEVSEALEEYREGRMRIWYDTEGDKPDKPEGFPVELADILIRVFDLAKAWDIDLTYALNLKMDYNDTRPHRHGGKYA